MIHHNERDIEISSLENYLNVIKEKDLSALDVGCNGSLYFETLKKYCKKVDGVDIFDDGKTRKEVDEYFVNDGKLEKMKSYDLVTCISTLEHIGYQPEHLTNAMVLRKALAKRIGEIAVKNIFMTFPYGRHAVHENNFANVTNTELGVIQKEINCKGGLVMFFHNENPADEKGWKEIKLEEADEKDYDPKKGVRTIAILVAEK